MANTTATTIGTLGGAHTYISRSTPDSPILFTSTPPAGARLVVVVGGGGNGARILPPLSQMLRGGDRIAIVDDDIVEDRNLLRQHFSAADIGQPKAAVLATRYNKPGRNVLASAFCVRLTMQNAHEVLGQIKVASMDAAGHYPTSIIVVGCVDNPVARKVIHERFIRGPLDSAPCAWIDIGNENRSGQVITSLYGWPAKVMGGEGYQPGGGSANFTLYGVDDAMPQLLRAQAADDAPTCADRIDIQTVQVNHMASSAALNAIAQLLLGIPTVACGAFFSTLNTMQPIKLASMDWQSARLTPDTTWAQPEEPATASADAAAKK